MAVDSDTQPALFEGEDTVHRKCKDCGEAKPLDEFKEHPRDGVSHYRSCLKCFRRRDRYKKRERYATWEGKHKQQLANAKQRAKNNGLEWNLDWPWFRDRLKSGCCEASGVPFRRGDGKGKHDPYAPEIDRIDPDGGYTKENTQVVVRIYNIAKNDWGHEHVMRLARHLLDSQRDHER